MECEWYDVACQTSWMMEEVQQFFIWMLEALLAGVVAIIASIPVPSWANGVSSIGGSISSGVAYFAGVFRLGFGASIIASSYGIRFLIRRLPLIG